MVTKLYFKEGLIKAELGVAKGKEGGRINAAT